MLSILGVPPLKRAESRFFSKHAALLDIVLRVSDVLVIATIALAVYRIQFGNLELELAYTSGLIWTMLLALVVFPAAGLYRSWRGEGGKQEIGRLWLAWTCVLVVQLFIAWALKTTEHYSRVAAGTWFVSVGVVLTLDRLALRWALGYIRTRGVDSRRVLLIGGTQAGQRIVSAARENGWMGLEVIGYISTPYDQILLEPVPCLGELEEFSRNAAAWGADQIWIALPMRAESEIQQILRVTLGAPVTIRLVPDFFGFELINHHATDLGGVPVITLRGTRVEGHARIAKAIFDRLFAACALCLIWPLLLMVASGVKVSSAGPVLFKQRRHGLGGKEIEVWKFRTMHLHQESDGKVTQATRIDHRVTSFGRFLRRTSLDELPQFFNVLCGDMSVVGPRPHAVAHNDQYKVLLEDYMQRHQAKPGITGWAQVNGYRGETDTIEKMASRVEYDLYYLGNWSLWFDLRIIALTLVRGFRSPNAF